jgi:hypothetical protein
MKRAKGVAKDPVQLRHVDDRRERRGSEAVNDDGRARFTHRRQMIAATLIFDSGGELVNCESDESSAL